MPAPGRFSAAERDEDLMLAYAGGAAGAFDALYARHKGPLYRYVLRHCGNAGTADELFQDVWTRVIRSRASYVASAKFSTWLYTLARNRLVDHWRAHGQVRLVSMDDEDDPEGSDLAESLAAEAGGRPEERAGVREIGERLAIALRRLPSAQRDAFLLHQEGGFTLAEIAALTGAGVETVKSRLRYASARLCRELGDLR